VIRLADRAGIQHARGADHLVARDVCVAVEKEIRAAGALRRLVDEEERFAAALEPQRLRQVDAVVAIAKNSIKRTAKLHDARDHFRVGEVAEVPDFIGGADVLRDVVGELSMGVGNDGDAHGREV
jgi:hypothetical protein